MPSQYCECEVEYGSVVSDGAEFFEAGACGVTPLVMCPSSEAAQVIEHGENGWLLEGSNANTLYRALVDLANIPDRCRKVGQAFQQLVREQHSFQVNAQKYERILELAARA